MIIKCPTEIHLRTEWLGFQIKMNANKKSEYNLHLLSDLFDHSNNHDSLLFASFPDKRVSFAEACLLSGFLQVSLLCTGESKHIRM